MAFNDRIRLVVDATTKAAQSELNRLRTAALQADTAVDKVGTTARVGLGGHLKAAGAGLKGFASSFTAAFGTAGVVGATAAGGAAIGKFAIDAVNKFKDLALGVDRFATATGTSLDEASRFVEVSNSLGVSAGTVEKAIGFMNRAVQNSPASFDALGVSITRTATGAVDVSETFKDVVARLGAMEDPAQRAAAAQKILGRSWMELGPIIAEVGGDVEKFNGLLADVSDAQIIDEDEVEKARRYRDAMDKLRDTGSDLAITIGEQLVPALADAAGAVTDIVGPILELNQAFEDTIGGGKINLFTGGLGSLKVGLDEVFGSTRDGTEAIGSWGDEMVGAAAGVDELSVGSGRLAQEQAMLAEETEDVAAELRDANAVMAEAEQQAKDYAAALRDSAAAIREQIDAQRAASDAQFAANEANDAFLDGLATLNDDLAEAKESSTSAADATRNMALVYQESVQNAAGLADAIVRVWSEAATARGETLSTAASTDLWNGSMIDAANSASGPLRQAILDHIAAVNGIPPEKVTEIAALLEAGKLKEAQELLDETSATRQAAIEADAKTKEADRALQATADKRRRAEILAAANYARADADLNRTAHERRAPILAAALYARADADLDRTASPRTATIHADAETSAAEDELQRVARTRNARINVDIVNRGGAGYGPTIHAEGGQIGAGTLGIVGEAGLPEFAHLGPRQTTLVTGPTLMGGPASITGGDETLQAIATAVGGYMLRALAPFVNGRRGDIIVNMPVGTDPVGTTAALRRWERRNGPR